MDADSFSKQILMNETELAFATIAEIARLFRGGKLSPVELTELMLARIERSNTKLNAYITVTDELARVQAKRAEAELCVRGKRKTPTDRGLLHGIPLSLKDNICTERLRTTAGLENSSRLFSRTRCARRYTPETSWGSLARQDQLARVRVRGHK